MYNYVYVSNAYVCDIPYMYVSNTPSHTIKHFFIMKLSSRFETIIFVFQNRHFKSTKGTKELFYPTDERDIPYVLFKLSSSAATNYLSVL